MSEAEPRLFVVMGASKSGTTWLQQMLDSHPQVRCHFQRHVLPWPQEESGLPESRVVFDAGGSPFAGLFDSTDQEARYNAELQYLVSSPFLHGKELEGATQGLTPEAKKWVAEVHDTMLRAAVKALLMDVEGKVAYGTKAATDLNRFLGLFPQGQVIHLLRDGRDVTVSKRFHMLRRGAFYVGDERFRLHQRIDKYRTSRILLKIILGRLPERGRAMARRLFVTPGKTGPLLTPATIEKFAGDWKALVEYVRRVERTHESNFLTLRYENLLDDTANQLKAVFDFIGVDGTDAAVSTVISTSQLETARLKRVTNGFLRKGGSGDWKTYFDSDSTRLFKQTAGDTLVEFGYESDCHWGPDEQ